MAEVKFARMEHSLEAVQTRCVRDDNGCLVWQGATTEGYGTARVKGTSSRLIHRIVYELVRGPIPDGMFVCHRCDNPPCCEIEHLFLGTIQDNHADMCRKGRGRPHHRPVGSRSPFVGQTGEKYVTVRPNSFRVQIRKPGHVEIFLFRGDYRTLENAREARDQALMTAGLPPVVKNDPIARRILGDD